jgi:para-aminobenzoate synthetase component 1
MISTVTPIHNIRQLKPSKKSLMEVMTGAPKISAMKIIEELEETKRGLYSEQ